jgi:hypothetical protein
MVAAGMTQREAGRLFVVDEGTVRNYLHADISPHLTDELISHAIAALPRPLPDGFDPAETIADMKLSDEEPGLLTWLSNWCALVEIDVLQNPCRTLSENRRSRRRFRTRDIDSGGPPGSRQSRILAGQ